MRRGLGNCGAGWGALTGFTLRVDFFRRTPPLLAYPRAQAGFSSVPTPSCHLRTHNARACGRRDIDKHHSRIATSRTRRRTTSCPFY